MTKAIAKYGNKKAEVDGIKFDSRMEAQYYLFLKEEREAGRVKEFSLQPKIMLQPSFRNKDGELIRAITYSADFLVTYPDGSRTYIDVKGDSTQQGELKRKMFLYTFPDLKLEWVAPSKKYSPTGWIDYFELKKLRRQNKRKCELT